VGGPFAGVLQSVFLRSPLLLVRWVDAWGCGGGRSSAWVSFGTVLVRQVFQPLGWKEGSGAIHEWLLTERYKIWG
jgi:hypothetical protein